jgi:rare lipoprotein A
MLGVLLALTVGPAAAKTPGTTYCYVGVCHRVLTLEETRQQVGSYDTIIASFYDVPWRDPFNPSLATSSGETFRADGDDSAASPIYPDGTRLLVRDPDSGAAAVVRVNNAGPYFGDRQLDLSRGAAERLGLGRRGVGRVEVMVLTAPSEAESAYQAGRTYSPVPGYIGSFDSIGAAHSAWLTLPDASASTHGGTGQAATLPPPPLRVVIIPGRSGRARNTRVVLLPAKLRRAPVLRAALARKSAEKRKQASSRR